MKKGLDQIQRYTVKSDDWQTPADLYAKLDSEFHFDDDPCPYKSGRLDGLSREWGKAVFCNPPYSDIAPWVKRSYNHAVKGNIVVMLLPANRTDRLWWHEYCMKANEFRFVKGRLKFSNSASGAAISNVIVIFTGSDEPIKISSIDTKGNCIQ